MEVVQHSSRSFIMKARALVEYINAFNDSKMNYVFKWLNNFMDLIAYDQSTAYIIKSIKFMHSGLKNT